MVGRKKTIGMLLIMVVLLSQVAPVFAISLTTIVIDFEQDTREAVANDWQSVDSSLVSFSDSDGSNLAVLDSDFADRLDPSTNAIALFNSQEPDAKIVMEFAVPMESVSFMFGNDDTCCSDAHHGYQATQPEIRR